MIMKYNKIEFTENFDCILCLNADLPDMKFFGKMTGIPVFAADGAASGLIDLGISPAYVVGDLDSFRQSRYFDSFDKEKIVHLPEQESNDFEKLLKFVHEKGFRNIVIIGFHGGELEHTLNNWSVFRRFSEFMNICICDRERFGISVRSNISLLLNAGEMVSLIPQPSARLCTRGLKWGLDNEVLSLGSREGARNIAVNGEIEIEILEGEILLFINERLPLSPFS